jgi:hypothetical protein
VALAILAMTAPAAADERPLAGAEIAALLTGRTVVGVNGRGRATRQRFEASGLTVYVVDGEPPSHGRWKVEGDAYCSTWPPSETWTCYRVTGAPDATPVTVSWIGDSGKPYRGIVEAVAP